MPTVGIRNTVGICINWLHITNVDGSLNLSMVAGSVGFAHRNLKLNESCFHYRERKRRVFSTPQRDGATPKALHPSYTPPPAPGRQYAGHQKETDS